ncbi:DUF4817 domain-containing protein [Trichonephila clavipes]|uniref:DUF4817 domain-containing protein n=1 Tax=Trichonephila clavipes TaxID=2585209 RepID=A0A8X6SQG9_TRICX|nr:DUF4817 domain-containing protein [Trichonephila clavipes]
MCRLKPRNAMCPQIPRNVMCPQIPSPQRPRNHLNMATMTEKSFCALEYARVFSVISVPRAFKNHHGNEASTNKSILRWYHQFKKTGCLCKKKSSSRPNVLKKVVERSEADFSPQKSTRVAPCEFGIP